MEAASDPLKEWCAGDEELQTALGYFLLHEPERQIPILGTVGELVAEAESALAQGNKMKARINLETAVRIAIHDQDEENAKKLLILADGISESKLSRKMHRRLISDMTSALRIAKTYYEQRSAGVAKSPEPAP